MVNVFSVHFNYPDFNYTARYPEFEVLKYVKKTYFCLLFREQRFQAGKCSQLIFLLIEDLTTIRNPGTGGRKLPEFNILL